MKKLVLLLIILLVLWIAGASYWFTCRTRCDCRNSPAPYELSGAQDSALTALNAAVEEAKTFLTSAGTQRVYFETSRGSTEDDLVPDGYLTMLKLYLENHSEATVTVTGHTDNQGPADFNMMLSNLRAKFVMTHFIMDGIKPEQIATSGKGVSEPVGDNSTSEGREQNRRTEINIKL
ncbi:MAG TPA: OmpA family protein [Bacteroidales bacterium]|nr:OmpA family protein [Bacteroidales bacterium]